MKNIVFIVESVPDSPKNCPFSKWHSYPPIVKSPGYYECKLGGDCVIGEGCCRHMKAEMRG